MERIEKRLTFRIFGQGGNIEDQDLMIETRLIRYLNEREKLGRYGLTSWIIGAMKNQFILEQSLDSDSQPPEPLTPSPKKSTDVVISAPKKPINEPAPTPKPNWGIDSAAQEKLTIKG